MKSKIIIITTIVFFIIVNTIYYWEGKLGLFAFPVFAVLGLVYVSLVVILIGQVFFAVKEKFIRSSRLLAIGVLIIVLSLIFYKPSGWIDFDKWDGENLLIAQREGAANCMTTLKLKSNNKFVEKSVCFGVTEVKGTYILSGDTIYFNTSGNRRNAEYYLYAVINQPDLDNQKIKGALLLYKTVNDTTGMSLSITKNEFK